MTRKHYIKIAKAFYECRSAHKSVPVHGALGCLEDALSRIFVEDNPSFDADRFRSACANGKV